VECRTRRKARQAVKETIHVWLQDRQPPGRHRTVVQWLPNGYVSKRVDCWEVHTGQVNLFNTAAIGKYNGLSLPCVMNAGLWTRKSQSTCQLVRAVQSFVKYQLSQVVSLWDMLFNFETYCLMLSHTSHKFTAKKPMTRLHASSLMFCQDNQWDRMSNLQTGCPTSRHTVWSWDMPHTRSLPRRLLRDFMQALSYFVKTINEPECLVLRQVVQLRDILSDLETCLTQDYCQCLTGLLSALAHIYHV